MYYPKLYNYADGAWELLYSGKGGPIDMSAKVTPVFLDGLAIGLCKCGSTTGILAEFIELVGDPVSMATGAFSDRVQDLKMAAPGIAFDLTRVCTAPRILQRG